MLAITHLAVSLLLIQLLALDRNDAFVALLFGVFVDIDHLLGLEGYVQTHGLKAVFDLDSLMNPGGQWKSMFHSPLAAAVVGPLSIASRFAIPLFFWAVHMAMDYLEDAYLGLFSAPEATLLVLAALGFVSLRYASYIERGSPASFMQYVRYELSGLRNTFSGASGGIL